MNILKKYKNSLIISLIIIIMLLFSYGILNIGFFSNYSIGVSDFKNQYLEFFKFYRENLFTNFDKFIYNQGLGLGNEMYGLFNYYLASPLNLILFLFPKNNIEDGVMVIIYLKLILGGIFFEKYLNKFNINNMFRILLPIIYVFSGYFIFNLINPIWLDICYMLPLTMISLDLLINKGIKKWFILSASLMVIINFYIGYMLCLFSFIYLMYEYFLNKFNKDVFINYIISAVMIITTSITTLYTSYLSMSMSKGFGGDNTFDNFFKQIISPLDFLSKFVMGSNGFSQISAGYPNVWMSSLIGVLFLLMLFDSRVKNKIKIINISFVLVIYFIFSTNGLNLIFHGLSNPIWFLYRDSFIFIFLILTMVGHYLDNNNLKEYSGIKNSKLYIILISIFYSLTLMLSKITYTWQNILSIVGFWLMLGLVYFILIKNKKLMNIILILGVILGVSINTAYTIFNPYKMFGITHKETYQEFNKEINDVEKVLNDNNYSNNYRAIKNYESTVQEALNFNFNEFKGFSSNFNKKSMSFLNNLSQFAGDNYFQALSRNPLIDSIFANKYFILTKQKELSKETSGVVMVNYKDYNFYDRYMKVYWRDIDNYNKIGQTKHSEIYENPYALQTFFTSNYVKSISKDFTKDTIKNQNILYQKLFNKKDNIISKADINYIEELNGISKSKDKYYIDSDKGYIKFIFESDSDFIGYLDNNIIGPSGTSNLPITFKLFMNGSRVNTKITYEQAYNKSTCSVNIKKGKNVIKLEYKVTDKSKFPDKYKYISYKPNIFKIDARKINSTFQEYLDSHKINVSTNNTTEISVKLKDNKDLILRSTIPYDKNWKAFYNDKELDVKNVDSFIAVDVSNIKNGTINFTYKTPYILPIIIINIASLVFVCFIDKVVVLNKKNRV